MNRGSVIIITWAFSVPCHACYMSLSLVSVIADCLFRLKQGSPQQEEVDGPSQDNEKPEPSRRKRQPSMSETMPLYTLCKEDLESMDKEVRTKTQILFICSHTLSTLPSLHWSLWCVHGVWINIQSRHSMLRVAHQGKSGCIVFMHRQVRLLHA